MMQQHKKLKFRYDGEIRTIVVQPDTKFADLRRRLLQDYGFDHSLKYEDDEGDYVTLSNQNDFESLLLSGLQTVNVYVSEALPSLTTRGHTGHNKVAGNVSVGLGVPLMIETTGLFTAANLNNIGGGGGGGGTPTYRDSSGGSSSNNMNMNNISMVETSREANSNASPISSLSTTLSVARHRSVSPSVASFDMSLAQHTSKITSQKFPALGGGNGGNGNGLEGVLLRSKNMESGGTVSGENNSSQSLLIGVGSDDTLDGLDPAVAYNKPRMLSSSFCGGEGGKLNRLDSGKLPLPMQLNVPRRLKRDLSFSSSNNNSNSSSSINNDNYYNSNNSNSNSNNNNNNSIRWKKGEMLGQGAFGVVYLGLNIDSGELMAVKQMTIDEVSTEGLTTLENEIKLLQNLRHQNIVRYIGTETNALFLSIFLEYVPGGSIKSLIDKFGPLEESVVRSYARQILLGLEYLHRHGFAHRDIKGANCLVGNDGVVKLADFGSSKVWRPTAVEDDMDGDGNGNANMNANVSTNCGADIKGTPCWMAPEIIRDHGPNISWKKADVWSMGCTALEMASGRPPWSQFSNAVTIIYHITCQDTLPLFPESASTELTSFLNVCLERDTSIRPDATSLLLHPFVANNFGSSWGPGSSKTGTTGTGSGNGNGNGWGSSLGDRPTTVSTAPLGGGGFANCDYNPNFNYTSNNYNNNRRNSNGSTPHAINNNSYGNKNSNNNKNNNYNNNNMNNNNNYDKKNKIDDNNYENITKFTSDNLLGMSERLPMKWAHPEVSPIKVSGQQQQQQQQQRSEFQSISDLGRGGEMGGLLVPVVSPTIDTLSSLKPLLGGINLASSSTTTSSDLQMGGEFESAGFQYRDSNDALVNDFDSSTVDSLGESDSSQAKFRDDVNLIIRGDDDDNSSQDGIIDRAADALFAAAVGFLDVPPDEHSLFGSGIGSISGLNNKGRKNSSSRVDFANFSGNNEPFDEAVVSRYKKNSSRFVQFDGSGGGGGGVDSEVRLINDSNAWLVDLPGTSDGSLSILRSGLSGSPVSLTGNKASLKVKDVSSKATRHSAPRSGRDGEKGKIITIGQKKAAAVASYQTPQNAMGGGGGGCMVIVDKFTPKISSIPSMIDGNLGAEIDFTDSISTSAFSPIRTVQKSSQRLSATNAAGNTSFSLPNSNSRDSRDQNTVAPSLFVQNAAPLVVLDKDSNSNSNSSNSNSNISKAKKEKGFLDRSYDLEGSLDSLDLKITGSSTNRDQRTRQSRNANNSTPGPGDSNTSSSSTTNASSGSTMKVPNLSSATVSKNKQDYSNNSASMSLASQDRDKITDDLSQFSSSEDNFDMNVLGTPECLTEHTAAVTRLKIPKRTKLLISSSLDGTVRIWGPEFESRAILDMNSAASVTDQKQERKILLGNGRQQTAGGSDYAYSSSSVGGNTEATNNNLIKATNVWAEDSCDSIWGVGSDNAVRVWAGSEGRLIKLLKGHEDTINVIEGVSGVGGPQESCLVATGSVDKTVRIWDIRAKRPQIFIFKGHSDAVTAIRWGEGGRTVFSSSKDRTIRIWDTRAGRVRATLEKHFGAVNALRAIPESSSKDSTTAASFISAGRDSMLHLWTVDGDCIGTAAAHRGGVQFISEVNFEFNRNFGAVVTLGADNAMKVWDLKRFRCVVDQSLPSLYGSLSKAVWCGRSVITASSVGLIRQWNIRNSPNLSSSSSSSSAIEDDTQDSSNNMVSTDIGNHSSPCTDLIQGESLLASAAKSGQIFRWSLQNQKF